MEPVGNTKRGRDWQMVVLAGVALLAVAIVLLRIPLANQLENRIYDGCYRVVHWYRGVSAPASAPPAYASPQIGFVAIDDRSVDPDYSPYSTTYGRDGWVTRSLWNLQLEQMGQIFQPKVLAYDILFRPTESHPGDDASVQTLHAIENKGNQDFQNALCDFEDRRSQGLPAPKVVFAYEFPDDAGADERLLNKEKEQQQKWFKRLDQFRLPDGSVAKDGRERIHHTVRLPMDEILAATSYYLGSINAQSDLDGIYRRVPLIYAYQAPGSADIHYAPGLALESFLLWLDIDPQDLKKPGAGLPSLGVEPGGELTIQTDRDRWSFPVDDQFRMRIVPRFIFKAKGRDELFQPSFIELLERGMDKITAKEHPETLENATFNANVKFADESAKRIHDDGMILVVGEAFTGGTDVGDLPLEQAAPRPLVHLHALNNFLQKDHLDEIQFPGKALVCTLLVLAMAGFYLGLPQRIASRCSLALIFLYPLLAFVLLVGRSVQFPLIAPTAVCVSGFGLISYDRFRQVRREREQIRRIFSSATSPRILRLLEENPEAFYAHRKTSATLLFSDVEGFTSLSEKLDPAYLATLINRYLSPMTEIIVRHEGYLDKYSGDGIMAIWGVPFPDAGHEFKACAAAWYQIEAARALEETLPDGKPYKFRVRIGINTGVVSAGNMGSAQKMQYTVMGDEVNLAARLEPTNKDYGTQIILGPQTYAAAKDRIWARKLDKIIVKGRTEGVVIYELLGLTGTTAAPGEWATVYEEGMDCLWRREWDEADRLFARAAQLRGGDAASELQRERIRQYRAEPPGADWQGAFTRLKKD